MKFRTPRMIILGIILGAVLLLAVGAVQAGFILGPGGWAHGEVGQGAPGMSASPTPSTQPSFTPEVSETLTESPTPIASGTPAPGHQHTHLMGVISAMSADQWTIDSTVVQITSATRIVGNPGVGDRVNVKAWINADGSLTADKIENISPREGQGPHDGKHHPTLTGTEGTSQDGEDQDDDHQEDGPRPSLTLQPGHDNAGNSGSHHKHP